MNTIFISCSDIPAVVPKEYFLVVFYLMYMHVIYSLELMVLMQQNMFLKTYLSSAVVKCIELFIENKLLKRIKRKVTPTMQTSNECYCTWYYNCRL